MRENKSLSHREGGRLWRLLASLASQMRGGVLKQRWGAMTRRKDLAHVGEEGRKGFVVASDVLFLGGGRRRCQRPWPAEVSEVLMMIGHGFGSRRKRGRGRGLAS